MILNNVSCRVSHLKKGEYMRVYISPPGNDGNTERRRCRRIGFRLSRKGYQHTPLSLFILDEGSGLVSAVSAYKIEASQ